MTESLLSLAHGLSIALEPKYLLLCVVGCFWGSIVGVLPGLGPMAGMAILLPITYGLDPTGAIIMLSGIFYGAMYGGSTTSILMRIPGEAASVITCIDGFEMTRRGRAGAALTIAAIGSFVGGTLSILGLLVLAPTLSEMMLGIGPAAECVIMIVALLVVAMVSNGPVLKTLAMLLLGLLLATIGLDELTSAGRFTAGSIELSDGLDFTAIAIGLFGISELMLSFDEKVGERPRAPRLRELLPTKQEIREATPPTLRGSVIGFVFGIVPGVSHIVSTFVSYAVEKRLSKHPEQFGKGAVAGVAGPETANNATTGAAMVPLLVLGIPAIPSTAILLSALLVHDVQPGPMMIIEHPDVFWGLIASMFIGNAVLVVLNLPLVGLFVSILRTPLAYLAPLVVTVCAIGVYSINGSSFDLFVMLIAGLVGYVLRRHSFDVAPLLLAFVLSDRIEVNFRRALTISDGDYGVFLQGTTTKVMLAILVLVAAFQLIGLKRFKRAGRIETNGVEG
ncbi:tripartite tricarboxylate transporter permease [Terrihabitans sp. B22-R8]|uniref:tripartite tricarboxylate transporter permease n=1 Tax=Terrihabitans sp. B22-R8 TaxID=3425128 RepID=UPI00403D1E50